MFRLWLLELEKKNAIRKIRSLQQGPPSQPRGAEFYALVKTQYLKIDSINLQIESFRSNQLIRKAIALDLEYPPESEPELWSDKEVLGVKFRVLSPRGRSVVRSKIDAEKARRFEINTLWVTKLILPLLAACVGIIGALTGLIAILRK